ncbi:hypothetical protein [Novosphingobium kaempferiae]|uniref:hypothetical protein n=1 Tax=Novosphingobium kaempferiae TaxID=2896849 RepID=UPI001E39F80F|nr:hypothetical protein [Novosphingobium kaempferiae]
MTRRVQNRLNAVGVRNQTNPGKYADGAGRIHSLKRAGNAQGGRVFEGIALQSVS